MAERIYTEHSPVVQELGKRLQALWNKMRGALLDNPHYRAGSKYDHVWPKAAIKVLKLDLNPELFIRAQLRSPADASRCHPTFLTGPKAMERYKHFVENQRGSDLGFYVSQLRLIKRLRELGRSWDHIEQGSYNLSPLVVWAMFTLNGMPDRAIIYQSEAKKEFAKRPDVIDLFGPEVARLR